MTSAERKRLWIALLKERQVTRIVETAAAIQRSRRNIEETAGLLVRLAKPDSRRK